MPWLIFRTDEGVLSSLKLTEAQQKVTVGRSRKCQICTQHPSVSRQHAQIVFDGQGATVRDLGSRNGTFFERSRVATAQLVQGESFHCGQFLILFAESDHDSEKAKEVFAADSAQAIEEDSVESPSSQEPAPVEEVLEADVEVVEEPDSQEEAPAADEPEIEEVGAPEPSGAEAETEAKLPPPPPALFDQKIPEKGGFDPAGVPEAVSFGDESASRQIDWSDESVGDSVETLSANDVDEASELSQSAIVELELNPDAEVIAGVDSFEGVSGSPEVFEEAMAEEVPHLPGKSAEDEPPSEGGSRTLNVRGPAAPEDLASFQRAYGDLEEKYDTAQNRYMSLQDTVKSLESDLAEASASVLAFEQKMVALDEKTTLQAQESDRLRGELEEKAQETARLQGELSEQTAKTVELEATLSQKPSDDELQSIRARAEAVGDLEQKADRLQEELASEKAQVAALTNNLGESGSQTVELNRRLSEAEARCNELEAERAKLNDTLAERPSVEEIATVRARAERAELESSEVRDSQEQLNKRVEVVEAERDVQRQQADELKEEKEGLQQELRQLQAEISLRPSDESLAALQVEKEALETEYEELKQLFTNAPSPEDISEQNERNQRLEQERDELAGKLEVMTADSRSVQEKYDALVQKNDAQQATLEKAEGENRSAVTELADLHDQIASLTEENGVLARSNRQNVKRIAELMAQTDREGEAESVDAGELRRAREELKTMQGQADHATKKIKELESLVSSLQAIVDEASPESSGEEGEGSISWIVPLFERVNDAVSQWRNDSLALEELAKDLRGEQYTTDEERVELIENIEENAGRLKELSEELKQVMRENRSHLPS